MAVKVGIGVKASVGFSVGACVRPEVGGGIEVALACRVGLDCGGPAGVDGARNGRPGKLDEQAAKHMPKTIRMQRASTLLMVVPVLALRDAAQ